MTLPQGLLPLLPLKKTVVFPGISQVIKVGRERSINALLHAEKNGFWIVAIQQKVKEGEEETNLKDTQIEPDDVYSVGTLCRIDSMKGSRESGYQVVLRGLARVQLQDIHVHLQENYLEADSTTVEDIVDMNVQTSEALLDSLKVLSKEILALVPGNTDQLYELIQSIDDLPYLAALCASNIEIDQKEKQQLLETRNLKERVLRLLTLMQEFKQGLTVQAEIRGKLSQKLGQTQRNMILREQLKAIREELGESDDLSQEDKLREKIEKSGMPDDVRKVAEQELKRLIEIGTQAPEAHIIRNYIDLLVALPWKPGPAKEINLDEARATLEADHYGLEKVKKRIIQHLAVLKIRKENKGSILLFVGPPGVGKTSLGQSIAKALGRKFVRVSLGGVRDDAEVRGHRRTYIGAMPGRIIQGLKRAGENNPVFLLDEIDKLSRSFNGDPAAALLEVLDPEQNKSFLDHYLDVPYDLSQVFFIATANTLETIPGPLLDRMEVIDLSGYTTGEKMFIAKNHLIPKQLAEHGLKPEQVSISDEALINIIAGYTREAGVRDLQRKIAEVLRGISEKVLNATVFPVKVEALDLKEILGPEKFMHEITESLNPPGVTTGMAWTPVGGDILFIESSAMPGKGKLTITGQLGDVMKESAQIALSLVRSHSHELGVLRDLEKTDIHIHVPAGAIPKDGPSAGVTMLASLASLLSAQPVNPKLAMTGEITLRGSVMPVGGIKEKVIAAHRAGVQEVVLPEKNRKDLKEVPDEVKDHLKFYFADNVSDLFKYVLGKEVKFEHFHTPAAHKEVPHLRRSPH